MTKEQIFEIIKKHTIEVLVDIDPSQITIDKNLKDLGANSIDRVEITQYVMEELNIKVSRTELGNVKNILDLVEFFYKKINE